MALSLKDREKAKQVAALLKKSGALLFVTGAGLSADSGLPTYRGIGGLYEEKEGEDGMPIEKLLSGEVLYERPEITWKYLLQIEKSCRMASFNRGHAVIAEMEKHFPRVCILTQNVDGFHRQAGSSNVIDIHGDLHHLRCMECDYKTVVNDYAHLSLPPRCPDCQAIVRPDVVLFGEMLSMEKYNAFMEEFGKGFDMVFSIGTTSLFPYISQPVVVAKHRSTFAVEINPGNTEISKIVDIKISAGAAETLEEIWNSFKTASC